MDAESERNHKFNKRIKKMDGVGEGSYRGLKARLYVLNNVDSGKNERLKYSRFVVQ
jgi:hypothetical protein